MRELILLIKEVLVDSLRKDVPVNTHNKGYEEELKDQPQKLDRALHVNLVHQESGVMVDVVLQLWMVHELSLSELDVLSDHWHDHLVSKVVVQLAYSNSFHHPKVLVFIVYLGHEVAPWDQSNHVELE